MTDRARVAEPFQEYTNFRGLGLSRSKIGVLAGACDSNPGSQVAAIQKAEADAATLAKEIVSVFLSALISSLKIQNIIAISLKFIEFIHEFAIFLDIAPVHIAQFSRIRKNSRNGSNEADLCFDVSLHVAILARVAKSCSVFSSCDAC